MWLSEFNLCTSNVDILNFKVLYYELDQEQHNLVNQNKNKPILKGNHIGQCIILCCTGTQCIEPPVLSYYLVPVPINDTRFLSIS